MKVLVELTNIKQQLFLYFHPKTPLYVFYRFFLLDPTFPKDNNLKETCRIVCIKFFFASFIV